MQSEGDEMNIDVRILVFAALAGSPEIKGGGVDNEVRHHKSKEDYAR